MTNSEKAEAVLAEVDELLRNVRARIEELGKPPISPEAREALEKYRRLLPPLMDSLNEFAIRASEGEKP
jgi:hypothetical protein